MKGLHPWSWLVGGVVCGGLWSAGAPSGWAQASAPAVAAAVVAEERPVVNVGFSAALFGNVNRADVDAALKVYARSVAEEGGFSLGGNPRLLSGTAAMAAALRRGEVDVISLTTEEFLAVEEQGLISGPLLAATLNRSCTEEYVLLTHVDSGIRRVEDLPGRSVVVSSDLRASLARIWLDVICLERGLGAAPHALGRLASAEKATLVILPVFFRQIDACVATRNGLALIGELNPQVSRQLRVVTASKPLLPTCTAFRRGFPETHRQRIIKTAVQSSYKPAFSQLRALFKTDELGQQSVSVLDSARELLAEHRKLQAGETSAQRGPAQQEMTLSGRTAP